MRRTFAQELHKHMETNKDIWLICLDLGYKVFDQHFIDFPDRCINPGAAEQSGMGIAVGLALEGKIPFVYSITTFLIYRPFETIRNYINHEQIPVRLIGSGRDKDYAHDGFSHDASDAMIFMDTKRGVFYNIKDYWPDSKEEIPPIVNDMIISDKPGFLSLRR